MRSRSPGSPRTPRGSRAPPYFARELGIAEDGDDKPSELRPIAPSAAPSRGQSRSRNSSMNGRLGADDFEFGRILGEGSYSTVRLVVFMISLNVILSEVIGHAGETPCDW